MNNPDVELQELMSRFGGAIQLVFDGAADECPICHHELSQLTFIFEDSVYDPASCEHCGAVLAA